MKEAMAQHHSTSNASQMNPTARQQPAAGVPIAMSAMQGPGMITHPAHNRVPWLTQETGSFSTQQHIHPPSQGAMAYVLTAHNASQSLPTVPQPATMARPATNASQSNLTASQQAVRALKAQNARAILQDSPGDGIRSVTATAPPRKRMKLDIVFKPAPAKVQEPPHQCQEKTSRSEVPQHFNDNMAPTNRVTKDSVGPHQSTATPAAPRGQANPYPQNPNEETFMGSTTPYRVAGQVPQGHQATRLIDTRYVSSGSVASLSHRAQQAAGGRLQRGAEANRYSIGHPRSNNASLAPSYGLGPASPPAQQAVGGQVAQAYQPFGPNTGHLYSSKVPSTLTGGVTRPIHPLRQSSVARPPHADQGIESLTSKHPSGQLQSVLSRLSNPSLDRTQEHPGKVANNEASNSAHVAANNFAVQELSISSLSYGAGSNIHPQQGVAKGYIDSSAASSSQAHFNGACLHPFAEPSAQLRGGIDNSGYDYVSTLVQDVSSDDSQGMSDADLLQSLDPIAWHNRQVALAQEAYRSSHHAASRRDTARQAPLPTPSSSAPLSSAPAPIATGVVQVSTAPPGSRATTAKPAKVAQSARSTSSVLFIKAYDDPNQPVPKDTSLEEMCQHYPNHLIGPGLDPFIQRNWSYINIWSNLPDKITDSWKQEGVIRENTQDPRTFLNNRLRNCRDELIKAGTYRALMEAPKLFPSGFSGKGGRHHERRLTETAEDVHKRRVRKSVKRTATDADDESILPEQPATKRAKPAVEERPAPSMVAAASVNQHVEAQPRSLASERPSVHAHSITEARRKADFARAFEVNFESLPTNEEPQGLLCGLPFWSNDWEFGETVELLYKLTREYNDKADDVVGADPDYAEADPTTKLGQRLTLLGWSLKSCLALIAALESSEAAFFDLVNLHLADVTAAMAKNLAYKYLTRMQPELQERIANGEVTPDLVKQVRGGVLQGVEARLGHIRNTINQKWDALKVSESSSEPGW